MTSRSMLSERVVAVTLRIAMPTGESDYPAVIRFSLPLAPPALPWAGTVAAHKKFKTRYSLKLRAGQVRDLLDNWF